MTKFIWVEVEVEHPELQIRSIHYVRVSGALVRPLDYASRQEAEKGYIVHGTRLWHPQPPRKSRALV